MSEVDLNMKSTQGLTFFIKGNSRWVNVEVTVEEMDNDELIISAECKKECIGKRYTSINNFDVVSTYGGANTTD